MERIVRHSVILIILACFYFNGFTQDSQLIIQTGHHSEINKITFSNSGNFIASAGYDKIVLWDTESFRQLDEYYINSLVLSMCFLHDDKFLAYGDINGNFKIIDISTSTAVYDNKFNSGINQLCYINETNQLLIGNRNTYLMNLSDFSFQLYDQNSYSKIIFQDNNLYTVEYSGKVRITDFSENVLIDEFFVFNKSKMQRNKYEKKLGKLNTKYQSKSKKNNIFFRESDYIEKQNLLKKKIEIYTVKDVIFVDNYKGIIYIFNNSIRYFDQTKQKNIFEIYSKYIDQYFTSLSVSTDKKQIFAGNQYGEIEIFDFNGKRIDVLQGHEGEINDIRQSPDKEFFAIVSKNDNSVIIRDNNNFKTIKRLRSLTFPVTSIALNETNEKLALGNNLGNIGFVDLKSSSLNIQAYKIKDNQEISKILFKNDSSIFIKASDKKICIVQNGVLKKEQRISKKNSDNLIFSEDGKYIFVNGRLYDNENLKRNIEASLNTNISLLNYQKEILLNSVDIYNKENGHYPEVNDILLLNDNKMAVTCGNDGFIKFWDLKQNKNILNYIPVDVNKRIAVTPDNYYFGPKDLSGIGFKVGLKYFPPEQFDLKYNRPDIVLKRLGFSDTLLIEAYHRAYLKRLKKMGFKEEDLGGDFHLPESEIRNFEYMPVIDQKEIELELNFNDSEFKLDRYNIWINDVPIFGVRGISLKDKELLSYFTTETVILSSGKNKIQVSCHNERGVESYKETVEIICEPKETVKPDLYVISIGVSEYLNSEYNLTYADIDAQNVADLFAQSTGIFKNVNLTVLKNRNATTENILNVKQELLKTKEDDFVIIFFAGHGLLDGYDFYLGTTGMDPDKLSKTALAYEDFESLLDGIPARKKLILIDACHSGEVDDENDSPKGNELFADNRGTIKYIGRTRDVMNKKSKLHLNNSFELMKELFADLRRGTGSVVISSAGGGEFAIEGQMMREGKIVNISNGIFTYTLIEGLVNKKADLNKDGIIYISELKEYVFDMVTKLSAGYQNPTSRRENLEMDFIIW